VTSYTPFFQSIWSYGARASGNTGTAVALDDLDGDTQNDNPDRWERPPDRG